MQFTRFVSRQILGKIQNVEKFAIFWKKHDFTKEMLISKLIEKALFNEGQVSFIIQRNQKCPTISEFKVTLSDESVSAVYTTNGTLIRSNETYESHMEFVFFSCFLRLICHLFTFCLFFSAGLSLKFL